MTTKPKAKPIPDYVNTRVKKLPFRPNPKHYYTADRTGPQSVHVFEESKVVFKLRVMEPEARTTYHVVDGWVVARTYPADEASQEARVAAAREFGKRNRAASSAAPFRAFLQKLTDELGAPTRRRACDVVAIHFAKPRGKPRIDEIVQEARAAGGAATICTFRGDDVLCVVSGGVERLAALFDWSWYGSGELIAALHDLDADAGLSFEHIDPYDSFALRLSRAPARAKAHARALGAVWPLDVDDAAAQLAKQRLRVRL